MRLIRQGANGILIASLTDAGGGTVPPTPGVMTFFIDPVNGDDNNSGESITAQIRTQERARAIYHYIRYVYYAEGVITYEVQGAASVGGNPVELDLSGGSWNVQRNVHWIGSDDEIDYPTPGSPTVPLGDVTGVYTAPLSAVGGLLFTLAALPGTGWVAGTDLRPNWWLRTAGTTMRTDPDLRAIESASAADALRYLGGNFTADMPAASGAKRIVQHASKVVVDRLIYATNQWDNVEFTNIGVEIALGTAGVFVGAVQFNACYIDGRATFENGTFSMWNCKWRLPGNQSFRSDANMLFVGSGIDGDGNTPRFAITTGSTWRIWSVCSLRDIGTFRLEEGGEVQSAISATLFFANISTCGSDSTDTLGRAGNTFFGRMRLLGTLAAGADHVFQASGQACFVWHSTSDVVKSDGVTPATVSMDGGVSTTSANVPTNAFVWEWAAAGVDYAASFSAYTGIV